MFLQFSVRKEHESSSKLKIRLDIINMTAALGKVDEKYQSYPNHNDVRWMSNQNSLLTPDIRRIKSYKSSR